MPTVGHSQKPVRFTARPNNGPLVGLVDGGFRGRSRTLLNWGQVCIKNSLEPKFLSENGNRTFDELHPRLTAATLAKIPPKSLTARLRGSRVGSNAVEVLHAEHRPTTEY